MGWKLVVFWLLVCELEDALDWFVIEVVSSEVFVEFLILRTGVGAAVDNNKGGDALFVSYFIELLSFSAFFATSNAAAVRSSRGWTIELSAWFVLFKGLPIILLC